MAGYTTASSSSSTCRGRYDVFLSFRGADTRKNFTDHLYKALKQAGIHTFRDDDEIRRGEDIDSEIQNAIHSTKLSLVLFSNDYASSRWCLDELAMIMKRRKTQGHLVLPVFYDVDPSQVAEQTGKYGEAFAMHEIHFKEDIERVRAWRVALQEAANLGGMTLRDR